MFLERNSKNYYSYIIRGHRITLDQPSKAEHTIWLLGDCVVYGIGVGNRGTIASSLQKRLNNDCKITFKVENYGHNSLGMGECAFDILFTLPIKDGDIVIMNHDSKNYNSDCRFVHHIDSITWLYRPHNYEEVFIDKGHTNENGNRIIGDKLFEFLKDNQYFIGYDASKQITPYPYPVVYQNLFGLSKQQVGRSLSKDTTIELDNFKQSLKAYRDNIGAIVMNCNPFTLGHRYLIEMASKQVKRLYIFVVEENLSTFPFKDRIELVKQGTADLPNVTVLPSGKFIISQLTFVDYFNKSELQEKAIDPTFDVELFAQEIAPTLGINTRFAGEEPLDKLTKQYNDTMREVLPKYDISYIEIPRKELDDAPISASRVRKLMNEGRYDDLKKLVPATTYDYLLSLKLP